VGTLENTRTTSRSSDADVLGGLPRHGAVLVAGLAAAVWFSAVVMLWFDRDVLTGEAVLNGNARGTVLVMAAVAVPLLLVAAAGAARAAAWAPLLWLGATAYLVYNGVILLFATPFNSLFLVYVAGFGLALGAAATLLRDVDAEAFAARFPQRFPARGLAAFVWTVVVLNTLVWLRSAVPAVLSDTPMDMLEGSGLLTNPIYAQDLAVWLPLMAIGARWLWSRLPWGYLLVGSGLTFWVLENVGVVVDQVVGWRADPTTDWASPQAAWLFAVFAAVTLVAAVPFYRAVHTRPLR
jgi:hypothetical protein